MSSLPPSPYQFRDVKEWAAQFYEFFIAQTRNVQRNDPLPVQLAHRTDNEIARAATDGILMYDTAYKSPVYAENGLWRPFIMDFGLFLAEQEILRKYGDTVSVISTAETCHQYGTNTDLLLDTRDTIWETGGNESYPPVGDNTIDTIVSDAAGDTSDVQIVGHTDAGGGVLTRVTQTVTLNGTTPVSLGTGLNRVEHAGVVDGETALVGKITITDSGAGTTHLTILAGEQASLKAALSVADGVYVLLTGVNVGIARANAGAVDFDVEARVIGSPFKPITGRLFRNSTGTTDAIEPLSPPVIIQPNSDIRIVATADSNNMDATAAFYGYYAEVQ